MSSYCAKNLGLECSYYKQCSYYKGVKTMRKFKKNDKAVYRGEVWNVKGAAYKDNNRCTYYEIVDKFNETEFVRADHLVKIVA